MAWYQRLFHCKMEWQVFTRRLFASLLLLSGIAVSQPALSHSDDTGAVTAGSNRSMKSVLCFGDSNTWGYMPGSAGRYAYHQRWPGVLQLLLGSEYHIIEEGLNGRTTVWDDPYVPDRRGSDALPMLLQSHKPLDLVVIMLGTNDLKNYRDIDAADAARGIETLAELVRKSEAGIDGKAPRLLVIAPSLITEPSEEMQVSFREANEKSVEFDQYYSAVARACKADYLNAAEFVKPDPNEGIHLDAEAHKALGKAVADKITTLFAETGASAPKNTVTSNVEITSVNHVGIRVKDLHRSAAFYELLGFKVIADKGFGQGHPVILEHPGGVVLNLLGPTTVPEDNNILMDVSEKYAGITHIALTVRSLEATKAAMIANDIAITGSFSHGNMSAIFIRDPDRNVIELDAYGEQPNSNICDLYPS